MDLPHIFRSITSVFESDPLLDEFGIVLSLENGPDGEKIFLVHSEHKLGLLYSAVKPLFQYALSRFYEIIKTLKEGLGAKKQGNETSACSHDGQSIIQLASSSIAAASSSSSSSSSSSLSFSSGLTHDGGSSIRELRQQLLSYSRVILLIRGDFPMAFSIRKGMPVI